MEPSIDAFRVGAVTVSPSLNRLEVEGEVVQIEPKVMEVLVALAARRGQVISRDELLATVWADTVVTDDALNRSISALRKALGDTPREPAFVETIPKRGYRLIPPVDWRLRGDSVPASAPVLDLEPRTAAEGAPPGYRRVVWAAAVIVTVVVVAVLLSRDTSHPLAGPLTPQPLTSSVESEAFPAVSPAGDRIAFARVLPEGSRIFVGQPGGVSELQITSGSGFHSAPAWTPDGLAVVHARFYDSGCEIWSASPLGGEERRIGACDGAIYPDVTVGPDGGMVYNGRRTAGGPFRLFAAGYGEPLEISSPPPDVWGDHDPVVSPDGRWLAFTRSASEGMQDLYVMAAAGGEATRLTSDARNILGSAWLEDSRTLVFSSNRGGPHQLWSVDREGGSPRLVPLADSDARHPSIAGGRLAYLRADADVNIWVARADSGGLSFVAGPGWDMHPAVSPAGDRIAFTSNRSGSYEVWVTGADGARRLSFHNGPFTSRPRWSADGARILYASRPDGNADLFVVDVSSGETTRLTETAWDEIAADWGGRGEVLFSSNRTGSWEGMRLAPDAEPEALGIEGAMGLAAAAGLQRLLCI